ncbi:MAG: hypothetical protein Q8K99_04895 [Actinomycetota bacterium]|nr:hypothetical protein [Actinomycetota bacterium]
MPKRSSRHRPADLNRLASSIVGEAVGDTPPVGQPEKDPAAVALGRKGGLKGGRARAENLTAERRSEIARNAAKARWERQDSEPSRLSRHPTTA